jgi:acyl carrier protein
LVVTTHNRRSQLRNRSEAMSTQETPTHETSTHEAMSAATDTFAVDRVVGIVHEILARRSVNRPIRPILLDDDLRELGLTSLDMVNLMLAVEAEFELKIPDADMTLRNFRSISAINALVASLIRNK